MKETVVVVLRDDVGAALLDAEKLDSNVREVDLE